MQFGVYRNYVILRNCRTPIFEHGQNLKTFFQNFSFLLQIALWALKKVPKPRISDFSISREWIITYVDPFHSEMKKNSISHILVPIWGFKMVYNPVSTCFLTLRRRTHAWVMTDD